MCPNRNLQQIKDCMIFFVILHVIFLLIGLDQVDHPPYKSQSQLLFEQKKFQTILLI